MSGPSDGDTRESLVGGARDGFLGALLDSLRRSVAPDPRARALSIEMWGEHIAGSLMGDGVMPSEYYDQLGEALAGSDDPDAPAALAALALAVDHADAAGLRGALRRTLGADQTLGIGEAEVVAAREVRAADERSLILEVRQGDGAHDHTVEISLDPERGWVTALRAGPPWPEVAIELEADGATVTALSPDELDERIATSFALHEEVGAPDVVGADTAVQVVVERRVEAFRSRSAPSSSAPAHDGR